MQTILTRLFDELHDNAYPDKLKQSELVQALTNDQSEVRNLAIIVAKRRGIQIVEVKHADNPTE